MAARIIPYTARDRITLEDLEQDCQTGDILLFSGEGLFAAFEEFFNYSEWGHVAVVYRHKRWGPCVWESSTRDATHDLLTKGSDKDGPRLIRLREKVIKFVNTWGSKVAWRKLWVRDRGRVLCPDWQQRLSALVKRVHMQPFEKHKFDMARSLVPWIPGAQEGGDETSYFCSELVARTLMEMGLFPDDPHGRRPENYTVIDFAQNEDKNLPFPRDGKGRPLAWLGLEEEIDVPS